MIGKEFISALIVLGGFLSVALIKWPDAVHIALHQVLSREQYEIWVRPYTLLPLTFNFRGEFAFGMRRARLNRSLSLNDRLWRRSERDSLN